MIELKSNPVQLYKARVSKIKGILPTNWKEIIIRHYPQYNTMKGSALMSNVYLLRSSDVTLTEIMEKIANKKLQ